MGRLGKFMNLEGKKVAANTRCGIHTVLSGQRGQEFGRADGRLFLSHFRPNTETVAVPCRCVVIP